jgi:hypothetical protein
MNNFPQNYYAGIVKADTQDPPEVLERFGMTDSERSEVTRMYGAKRVRKWAENLLNRGVDDKHALKARVSRALNSSTAFRFDNPSQFRAYLESDAFSAVVRADREALWRKIEEAIPRVLSYLRGGESRADTQALLSFLTKRGILFYGRLEDFAHLNERSTAEEVRAVYQASTRSQWRGLYTHIAPTVSADLIPGARSGVLPTVPGAFADLTPPRIPPTAAAEFA